MWQTHTHTHTHTECMQTDRHTTTGDRRGTNTFILTFHSSSPPKDIMVEEYLLISVTPYIPNPLRFFKCQKFGHTQNSCKGQQVCARSATPAHETKNCNEPKCANRKRSHITNAHRGLKRKRFSSWKLIVVSLLWRLERWYSWCLPPEMDVHLQQHYQQEFNLSVHNAFL